jgi:hypothetical protein
VSALSLRLSVLPPSAEDDSAAPVDTSSDGLPGGLEGDAIATPLPVSRER